MGIITRAYEKYILWKGTSLGRCRLIERGFLDRNFAQNNYGCPILTTLSTIGIYLVLMMFPHNNLLHWWFGAAMIFYIQRVVMTFSYKDGGTRFFFKWYPYVTHEILAVLGLVQAILCLGLLAIVFFDPLYPIQSKIAVMVFLLVFTPASLSIYYIIPMWGTFFILTIYLIVAAVLMFQGWLLAITGLFILAYALAMLGLSYRSYNIQFQAIYQKFEIQELADQLDRLARTDKLTGVTNRLFLDEKMEAAFRQVDRTEANVAILFLDFDRFKFINDTYGHHVGDELLKGVVQRLKKCIRETDEIFRIGGDEFVIMLTNVQDRESVAKFSTDLIQVLDAPYIIEGISVVSNVSIGIGIYPIDKKTTPEEILHFSDLSMYKSKERGGKTYTFYDPIFSAEEAAGKTAKKPSTRDAKPPVKKRQSRTVQNTVKGQEGQQKD